MSIRSYTYADCFDINTWLSNSSNATLLRKWHTPANKIIKSSVPRSAFVSFESSFNYDFTAADLYYNDYNGVCFKPDGYIESNQSSSTYYRQFIIFGIQNGGVYYEADGVDCDIMSIKSITPGDRFSILAQEGLKTVIYGAAGNDSTVYLYTDETRYNPSGLPAYMAAKKALANGVADKYIAQPIVINGIKTPLYSIVSNTASSDPELFTEVVIGGQRFFVIDYGVGVRI